MTGFVELDRSLPHMRLHELNNSYAAETSHLISEEWEFLLRRARFAFASLPDRAFLLAFDEKPAEVSPNFDWFCDRHKDFVYVDRIVVSPKTQGEGLGRGLYDLLFSRARAESFQRVACEINIDPPNPASLAFHERLGFSAVGEQTLAHNGKTVRYFLREL